MEARDVGIGRLVEKELLVSLPLNGRDVNQLIILAGNAVSIGGTSGDRAYPGAAGISVAGGTSNSTNYLVDGGSNNDPQQNSGNAMPFPDALQEFSVETGVRSARYGQSTGATVNAVTRAGTNNFNGSAFLFGRHHTFNAIRFFDRAENGGLGRDDGLKRAQSGGTLGGPIIANKLFFFGGVQITNTRIAPVDNDQFVPTAEVRRGDFTPHHVAGVPRSHDQPEPWVPLRQQPGGSGALQPDFAEGHEPLAAAGSGAGSGRVRTLRGGRPERQRRAAVHRPHRLQRRGGSPAVRARLLFEVPTMRRSSTSTRTPI